MTVYHNKLELNLHNIDYLNYSQKELLNDDYIKTYYKNYKINKSNFTARHLTRSYIVNILHLPKEINNELPRMIMYRFLVFIKKDLKDNLLKKVSQKIYEVL